MNDTEVPTTPINQLLPQLDYCNVPGAPIRHRTSPDSVSDQRIDSIVQRFSWFANPDHQWSPTIQPVPVNQYHLRRRPQIRCPACLNGELGQLSHMAGPHGCLYSQ